MSDFICINDRNQLPKYIPGYDTPEEAETASRSSGSSAKLCSPNATTLLGGPGSVVKNITILPISTTDATGAAVFWLDNTPMTAWVGTDAGFHPPVTLQLGAKQTTNHNTRLVLGDFLQAIVTGYFTPTV